MQSLAELFVWRGLPHQIGLACLFIFLLLWAFNKFYFSRRKRSHHLQVRDPGKGHRWIPAEFIRRPTYCSVCEEPFVMGSLCDSCQICTHDGCVKVANKRLACKALALSSRRSAMRHHFVKGNIPLCSICSKCGRPCGGEPRLCDIRCIWCQRKWHENCVKDVGMENCDLGSFSSLVVPPYSVTLRTDGWKGRRRLVVDRVFPPPSFPDLGLFRPWTPLLVLSNPKSGEKAGDYLLSAFRDLVNPVQVVNLAEVSPEDALDFCRLVGNFQCRVIVCGGDGTVGWVLAAIDKAKLQTPPVVGIIPLGTGNDLARVLGWGSGYTNEDVEDLLDDLHHADIVNLDRWNVNIEHSRFMGLRRPAKHLVMNNYFGIGCDACVTLNFHNRRESSPELFQSRMFNKAWYFGYGSKEVLLHSCKDLEKKMSVELDGSALELPELEGIVVLNIKSWGAGVEVWGDGDGMGPCRFDDGLLEVFGVYSSLHIARLNVSLADPLWLGRAKQVKIVLKSGWVPVHVDGEPWEQSPAVITISHHNQMPVLQKKHFESD
eukprot:m.43061 g.43061  ORF g.43061 m.43061 type:complete len:544 (+) comp33405_c0_seq10:12-1643(+)